MIDSFGDIFYSDPVRNWLLFFVILIVAIIVGKIVYAFFKHVVRKVTVKTKTHVDDILVDVIEEPVVLLIFLTVFWFAFPMLNLAEGINQAIFNILKILIVLTVSYFVVRLTDRLIIDMVSKRGFRADTQFRKLLPVIQKMVKFIVLVVAALVIFDILGLKLTSLLAGLGLGGLAVALAAKDTLSNVFGSVTVLADQPFKIGDKIKIDKFEGKVEEVGIRSTRIKTPQNTQVVIPNNKIASMIVENVSKREDRRKDMLIVLKQGTSADKIQQAIDLIKEALKRRDQIEAKFHVNFVDISTVGPVIDVIYWIKNKRFHREFQDLINFEIKRGFEKTGIEIAETSNPMVKGRNY